MNHNVSTSEKIGGWYINVRSNPAYVRETLYRSDTFEYFIVRETYAEQLFIDMTLEEACAWTVKHLSKCVISTSRIP